MSVPNLCVCLHVTEEEVVSLIRRGVTTVDAIGERCGAGQGCGGCRDDLAELIEDFADATDDRPVEAVTGARY
ncbi:(2Fe-2S)-binding protein [Streptomyces sp. NPDC087917]|uniref:(2Fe-2S)-binding protein n=1 Tax=unclassified Streptomyces TaxID=2593676 RepID=UPI0034307031